MRASVIIPAFNASTSICRSIDSALAQHPRAMEVIVVDDGSTDRTPSVLRTYGKRIRYLRQDNQGQGAARNAGMSLASGDVVAFLDADDYWLPGFLRNCVQFLEQSPEVVAVSTASVVKKWPKADVTVPCVNLLEAEGAVNPTVLSNFFDFWALHDHVRTGSVVIRRSVIDEAGFQRADLRISQDLEYWGYIATFGQWGFIPQPLFVTDGTPSAAAQGWTRKYLSRRKLCPTVDQWQSRITPRLRDEQWPGFRQVRARVAASFAHAKVLGGDSDGALAIVREYGSEFPPNWSSLMMKFASRGGVFGWRLGCRTMKMREAIKSTFVHISFGRRSARAVHT